MVFAGYSGFPHNFQLASHELSTIGINVTKNESPVEGEGKFLALRDEVIVIATNAAQPEELAVRDRFFARNEA